MLEALSGISLLAVIQADVSAMAAFIYYTKQEVEKKMLISFTSPGNVKKSLLPLQAIHPDLEVVLGVIKPILASAMGNLGSNLHFYVLSDKRDTTGRLMDPYLQGLIEVQLSRRDGTLMKASIEMPLDALYVPRKCPNGKGANISWKYCPWSGTRLDD